MCEPILIWFLIRGLVTNRATLVFENLALRQQLAVLRRSVRRPRLHRRDRLFWTFLARWPGWQATLVMYSPATVVRWHRQGFRLYWRWMSRGKPGRPAIAAHIRRLIRQIAHQDTLWGAPRVASELRLLGHNLADSTVAKYMPKRIKPPSQTWKTFPKNHVGCLASIDFCVVPTASFRVLYRLSSCFTSSAASSISRSPSIRVHAGFASNFARRSLSTPRRAI
jgi:hypothetical protein